jgi:hypothetical protein
MNSFLGGAFDYSGGVPDYGDVGAGYTGDYFNTSTGVGDIGKAILSGLSSLRSTQSSAPSYGARPTSYSDQTRSTMNNMLAQAIQAFRSPEALI